MSLRILIADDEAPLRAWLVRLLQEVAPDVQVVAQAENGTEALELLESLRPDAALLDIRMPGLSGLEVAAQCSAPCRIAFITAYDEFAVAAFEQAAVDYLMKPVTAERLALTLTRLRQNPTQVAPQLLNDLLSRLQTPKSYLRWLRVGMRAEEGQNVQLLDVAEVDYFEAADKYTLVYVGEQEWLMRISLKELEQQLDPDAFWRIHRGTLVRVAAIRQVRKDLMGRHWADVHNGKALAISRAYVHLFKQM